MATEIDELQISIKASADKASNALTKLSSNIVKLSQSLSKLNTGQFTSFAKNLENFGESVKSVGNIKTTDFNRITKNLGNLASVNVSGLQKLSQELPKVFNSISSLSGVSEATKNISELSSSIARFGYKSTTNAIINIPLLTEEFDKMIRTLAKSPKISRNLIDFTNALANLSDKGRKAGTASKYLAKSLQDSHKSIKTTNINTLDLALSLGKLYAAYRTVVGGIQGLWGSIESSSDYIEAFNYQTVAFNKIASEWSGDWEKYGYENSEAYSQSFTDRLNESFRQLSGVQINVETGLLESTGLKNLGLNIKEITQYAAQLASMTNAIGQTGEVSLATATAFTKLAGDMSSLFNLDFKDVADDIQSVLTGQSEAGYKYGWDTTLSSLQVTADKFNLSKPVSEMTKLEKQSITILTVLDQSKIAWGDLATTASNTSNSIRQLKTNLQEIGMLLGQLFTPILQSVLPVLNGVSIAIKSLLSDIAIFAGIEIDTESFARGFDGTADILDDVSDGLNTIATSSKKANTGLRAFDELNVISTQKDTGAGTSGTFGTVDLTQQILEATNNYKSIFDQAYNEMEDRAGIFANQITAKLEPLRSMFENIYLGEFTIAGADFSSFIVGINESLTASISSVDWEQIGENIGAFMEGINWTEVLSSFGRLFWEGINTSIDLWKGSFDTAPIETTILTSLLLLPTAIPIIDGLIGALDLLLIPFQSLSGFVGGLSVPIIALGGAFLGLATGLGYVFATNEDVRKSFGEAVTTIKENMQPVFEFVTDTVLPDLRKGFERLLEIFSPFAKFLEDTFTSVWQDILNPALLYFGEKVIPIVLETLQNLWNNVLVPLGAFIGDRLAFAVKLLSDGLSFLWKNVVVPLAKAVGSVLSNAFESVGEIINKSVIPVVSTVIKVFQGIWDKGLEPLIRYITEKLSPAFTQFFKNDLGGIINNVRDIFNGLIDFITGILTNNWKKAFTGMVQALDSIFAGIKNIIKTPVNVVIGGINLLIDRLQGGLNTVIKGLNSLNFDVPDWVPGIGGKSFGLNIETITLNKIKTIDSFEMGGYPKKSSLFWAGENGIPELLGTTGGKTAVAGGAEITGISNAIYQTHIEEMQLLREQNALLRGILEKEFGITDSQIFSSVRRSENQYYQRTGNLAFVH